jgi:hypothetical protein
MLVVQQIIPTRGREFWDSLDPNNNRQVLEAVKEEFDIPLLTVWASGMRDTVIRHPNSDKISPWMGSLIE